jgi:hypothetical protein
VAADRATGASQISGTKSFGTGLATVSPDFKLPEDVSLDERGIVIIYASGGIKRLAFAA